MRFLGAFLVLLGAAAFGQTVPTCNGRPATIVVTTPGIINGTNGDDVIVGSSGDDQIFGGAGNDIICGGGGNDQITGGQGSDMLFGEAGNDTFFWNPGDGSDLIEGGAETDSLVMTGANINEQIGMSANAGRLRLTRDIASVLLDAGGLERVTIAVRGGSDSITVASLAGIGLQQVALELEGTPGTKTPDGMADSIFVFATTANDQITLTGSAGAINIAGPGPAGTAPTIQVRNPDPTLDTLAVYGMEGNDRIDAQGTAAGILKLTLEGGPGADTLRGSAGADTLVGGDDDDTFEWPLGTPADLIAGDGGTDTLIVIGTSSADSLFIAAAPLEAQIQNGADGVTFSAGVEQVVFQARGGQDQATVNTLAASTLQKVTIDLRPSPTSTTGDSAADTITVIGTSNADGVTISGSAGNAMIGGMVPVVMLQGAEFTRDTLTVNGGAGDDVINAVGLAPDSIKLAVRGGQGMDSLTGGAGDDVFLWFPGDGSDTIDGGPGTDALQISGANIGENVTFSASGTRFRFTRDVGAVALDVSAVERVSFAAMGGADTISFTDLSTTEVRQVSVDLAVPGTPTGDAQADTIAITAPAPSAITTSMGTGTWTFTWSPVKISVTGVEAAIDRIIMMTATGSGPIISATPTAAGQ